MKNPKTKELLETYYQGFAKKQGWESLISEGFTFTADNMNKTDVNKGKETYIKIIERFSKVYQTVRVKKMIVQGDNASVIAEYDYIFSNGNHISGDVAEFWTVKHDKLSSLHIFFDTLTFDQNTPKK